MVLEAVSDFIFNTDGVMDVLNGCFDGVLYGGIGEE